VGTGYRIYFEKYFEGLWKKFLWWSFRLTALKIVGCCHYHVMNQVPNICHGGWKVILADIRILWVLASDGPPSRMDGNTNIRRGKTCHCNQIQKRRAVQAETSSLLLENSFIGLLVEGSNGNRPLGTLEDRNWRWLLPLPQDRNIVSTIATIYSMGEIQKIFDYSPKAQSAKSAPNGDKVYNMPPRFFLMVFYAFASAGMEYCGGSLSGN